MVLVNDKKFKVYQLDTKASILSRLASEMSTLPKYLSPVEFPLPDQSEVTDLLQVIKRSAEKSMDFIKLIGKINKKKSLQDTLKNLDMERDVIQVWLSYNKELDNYASMNNMILQGVDETLKADGYFPQSGNIDSIWQDRARIRRELEDNIKSNQKLSKRNTDLYKTFDQVDEPLVYTDPKIERSQLDLEIAWKNITILEIFNAIVLNEKVPFATTNNYYKILKDFLPEENWISPQEKHELLIKLNDKVISDLEKYKDYTDVKIKLEGEIGQEKVTTSLKLINEKNYANREELINRLGNVFHNLPLDLSSSTETDVVALFYFPQERIDSYVLSDLIMNNPIFSSLMSSDESIKATKKKSDSSQPWLYVHFDHPNTGHLTASITQKYVDRSDPAMKEEDDEIFSHGSPYIRVRAKGKNIQAIIFFQETLAKLLVLYNQEYNSIVEAYQVFLPDFGQIEEIELPAYKKRIGTTAPEIFVKNYSRYCPVEKTPAIVNDERAEKHRQEGGQVMVFPRDKPEQGTLYPSDGKKQQNYICPNPEFPFPGVQINKLDNSEQYPFVPCCFKNDQTEKQGNYRLYYHGEVPGVKEKKQQELIITDKILGSEKYGELPVSLKKLFDILDMDSKYKYIRVGVSRSHSSFLEAVMMGLYIQTGILDLTDSEERINLVLQTRQDLSNDNFAPMAKQCMYDSTITEIQDFLHDDGKYLNPKLTMQLLEEYFNCNIFLFDREKMRLPRYTQSYYTKKRDAPCVFIYEHMGSESDHAKYPQCELIVRWNTTRGDDTQYSFPLEQKIGRGVQKVFSMLNSGYVLEEKISQVDFPLLDDEEVKISSQVIDSYGKTRQLNLTFQGKNLSIVTGPIPPLAVKITQDNYISTNLSIGKEFLLHYGILSSQTVQEGKLVELNGQIGTVKVSIPIQPDEIIEDLEINYSGIHYLRNIKSSLDIYNRNKRYARYITEYLFWLFSKYVRDNSILEITDKILASFAKKKMSVIENFSYDGNVAKNFSENSPLLVNGKLVVTSIDMMKRLLYVLKMYTLRDLKTLLTYVNRSGITNYYVDITDFDQYSTQVILQGDDSIDKWIQENRFVYTLHQEISIGQRLPYFFGNKKVAQQGENPVIFLAKNTTDLYTAIQTCVVWNRKGYFSMETDGDENGEYKYTFTLYSYVSRDEIVPRQVIGRKTPKKPIRVLGYKIDGQPFYTALMGLD